MEATTVRLGRGGIGPALVPAAGLALAAGTIAYGFVARAEGTRLGASLAPFLWDWRPTLSASALPATALLATGVWLAPRLRAPAVRPWVFAAATLALGLALRPALGSARGGVDGLWAVYEVGNNEAANEYLPALPALDFGTLFFLDTFAEVGTSLPVHAIGHPPGLLLTLHWLGIDGAPGMAALTIGAGALAIPLTYALARELLDEERARSAALLYVFAPSALLYLATGYDPVGVLRATESVYREGVASRRPYEFWLFGSPVAFLCALGLPIAWFALRSAGARYAPAVALVAVVIVAAVLGFSKAETERIYQFLVPLACVSAAASLPERWLPLTLGALAVQALAIELLLYTV